MQDADPKQALGLTEKAGFPLREAAEDSVAASMLGLALRIVGVFIAVWWRRALRTLSVGDCNVH